MSKTFCVVFSFCFSLDCPLFIASSVFSNVYFIKKIFQDIKADEKDEEFIVDKDGNLSKTSPATTPISSLRDTDVAVEYNVGKYTKFNKPSQNGLHQNGLTDAHSLSYGTYEQNNLAFEGECKTRI